ncbi:MAG: VTT domain-containing protein [Candidatus Sungbacteria bacterium]|nr:VTT domain-containing protein [Candidatus Sungbacteria bacterium]
MIQTIGYLGLFAIAFADSGLLIGLVLPGDSLLVAAGVLAAGGDLNVFLVIAVCFIGAVAGDSVGYASGRKFGPRIFSREDSWFFRRDQLARAREFYEAHGPKTIVFARFIHFARTLVPMLAGAAGMRYRTFAAYNVIGGFLWVSAGTLLGFYLGRAVPHIERYLLIVVGVVAVCSFAPTAVRWWHSRMDSVQ